MPRLVELLSYWCRSCRLWVRFSFKYGLFRVQFMYVRPHGTPNVYHTIRTAFIQMRKRKDINVSLTFDWKTCVINVSSGHLANAQCFIFNYSIHRQIIIGAGDTSINKKKKRTFSTYFRIQLFYRIFIFNFATYLNTLQWPIRYSVKLKVCFF